jgi:hypothetical protein
MMRRTIAPRSAAPLLCQFMFVFKLFQLTVELSLFRDEPVKYRAVSLIKINYLGRKFAMPREEDLSSSALVRVHDLGIRRLDAIEQCRL